eukprot:TRINITY_DN7487_c0_g1_i1.p1 TRINITY_DN7487_c0_g1~~TRINITY_DN7487_c0_g1_i1.p1  ORF type:complete len:626 (+),score=194.23 TRINITY_DN7487_c0_g1_i1:70-1947(+)
MAGLLLFLRYLDETYPIDVPASANIGDLRWEAAKATGLDQCRLRFRGEVLADNWVPLADTGISSECVVEVEGMVLHVVWHNWDSTEPTDPRMPFQRYLRMPKAIEAARAAAELRQKYCGVAGDCSVTPLRSEEGSRVFSEYAADWTERTGLQSSAPFDPSASLQQLLERHVCTAWQSEETGAGQPLAAVPSGHYFVGSKRAETLACYRHRPNNVREFGLPGFRSRHGVWMYEVTVKRAAFSAFRLGWRCSHSKERPKKKSHTRLSRLAASPSYGRGREWMLCMRGGRLRGGEWTDFDLRFDQWWAEPSGPTPVDAGGELWHWQEGTTIATAIDFEERRILYGMPGKGWFVAFTDVDDLRPVMPAMAAVESVFDLNLGERPFACDPPAPDCRGVRAFFDDDVTTGPPVKAAGRSMPPRALLSHTAHQQAAARRVRRLMRERREWVAPDAGRGSFRPGRWFLRFPRQVRRQVVRYTEVCSDSGESSDAGQAPTAAQGGGGHPLPPPVRLPRGDGADPCKDRDQGGEPPPPCDDDDDDGDDGGAPVCFDDADASDSAADDSPCRGLPARVQKVYDAIAPAEWPPLVTFVAVLVRSSGERPLAIVPDGLLRTQGVCAGDLIIVATMGQT